MCNCTCSCESDGTRHAKIFEIPYAVYDKFIDSFNENFEHFGNTIPLETLEFLSTADNFEKRCTRHKIGEQILKRHLRTVLDVVRTSVDDYNLELLENLIEQCLSYIK